jgi:hypothetical protein
VTTNRRVSRPSIDSGGLILIIKSPLLFETYFLPSKLNKIFMLFLYRECNDGLGTLLKCEHRVSGDRRFTLARVNRMDNTQVKLIN